MKKLFLKMTTVLLFCAFATVQAQSETSIPQNVASAFSAKYPNVKIKGWKFNHQVYAIKYIDNGVKHHAFYSPDGTWIKTEVTHHFTYSLPKAVQKSWQNSAYVSWKIEGIRDIETPASHQYILTVVDIASSDLENVGSQRKVDLFYGQDGTLQKKTETHPQKPVWD